MAADYANGPEIDEVLARLWRLHQARQVFVLDMARDRVERRQNDMLITSAEVEAYRALDDLGALHETDGAEGRT